MTSPFPGLRPILAAVVRMLSTLSVLGVLAIPARSDTTVRLGAISQISSPADLDLEGDIAYAINFSADDPQRILRGVVFRPDRFAIPGATLVGPQNVTPWQQKPEFGNTADDNQLEEILQDIRWANSGAGERLRAALAVTAGELYKLQILFSANGPEDRRWDIRVDGRDAVDEITSLGRAPGQSYAPNRATLYTLEFTARENIVIIEMGNLFGRNDGGDRNPIWQALTLEKVFIPPTPDSIQLSATEFFPNQIFPIGQIQVVDRKSTLITHLIELVPGEGDADNARFFFQNTELFRKAGAFDRDPPGTRYSIRCRATDVSDDTRKLDQILTLTLREPHPPTSLDLDATSLGAGAVANTIIGRLRTTDPDAFDRHQFTLIPSAGSNHDALLQIVGDQLELRVSLPVSLKSLQFRIETRDLAGLTLQKSFSLPIIEPRVRINEFVAGNIGGPGSVLDESQQPQDWIELYNELPQAMNLKGWFLTDSSNNLRKWEFPAVTLPPNGFLIILADGLGLTPPGSTQLHANFSIGSSGESLSLVRPDGVTVVSQLSGETQFPGTAFGVGPDGRRGYLLNPTPGQPNAPLASAGENRVEFSHKHGFYSSPFLLELQSTLPGSVIRYTLDGSLPSPTRGALYSDPIRIEPNTAPALRGVRIVRAIATHTNAAFSPVLTQTYLFVNGVAAPATDGIVGQSRFVTSITRHAVYGPLLDDALLALPSLSVVLPSTLNATEQSASIELMDPAGGEAGFQQNCGVHATGTTSMASPKLSMAAKFRWRYGNSKLRYPVFARGSMAPNGAATEFKELRLRSHSHDTFFWLGTRENPPVPYGSPAVTRSGDAQLGRNLWIDEMQLLMGQPGKHGRQVHLYLNGSYHGLYHIHEHPDEDFMASYFPGQPEEFHFTGGGTTGSVHDGGDTWSKVWNTVKASSSTLGEARRWIDLTNLCDYMVLSFYAGNDWDWSTQHNWGAAGPKFPDRGGWKIFQQDSDITLQDVAADCTDQTVPDGIFHNLMRNADFRVLFRDRAYRHCFNDGVLTADRAAALYNARMSEIETAIIAETARWQPSSSIASLPWDRDQEWRNEWRYLTNTYFPQRVSRLIAQFRQRSGWWPVEPPLLNQHGGSVPPSFAARISADKGTVYFTLDGSDPRLPGGRINPAAQSASSPGTVLSYPLIAAGSTWRFSDTGEDLGNAWRNPAYDDSNWKSGPAQIGFGDGDEITVASFQDTDPNTAGIQKNITTYFRKSFDLPTTPNPIRRLRLRLLRDDGAVVYLNGTEIWRDNMPAGTIHALIPATASIGGADESTFIELVLLNGLFPLNPRGNVLGVEIHQQSAESSDLSFDFELIGESDAPASETSIPITQPTRILSRTYNGSDWSALSDAYFVPNNIPFASAQNLVVSEIHYNPLDLPDTEFIELLNTSNTFLQLANVQLAGAVSFTLPKNTFLPPNGRCVVVRDTAAFAARYQTNTSPYFRENITVLGPWQGALANSGDTLQVLAANGDPILSVEYHDDGSWPARADGVGSSLELIEPAAIPSTAPAKSAWLNQASTWRPSPSVHGSPGHPGEPPAFGVVLNEVLASPIAPDSEAIELFNSSASTVDLSGWFLSDSLANLKKYRFPQGSRIAPNQFLVLRERDFGANNNGAALTPFALSADGEDLILTQANANGDLLRFVDHISFPASRAGITSGRLPDGAGINGFSSLPKSTVGISNGAPPPGFQSWLASTFPPGSASPWLQDDADLDRDGFTNLAEYALLTSPWEPNGTPLTTFKINPDSSFEFTLRQRAPLPDAQLWIELSHDLSSWTRGDSGNRPELAEISRTPDAGAERVVWRLHPIPAPNRSGVARFLRVRVTRR